MAPVLSLEVGKICPALAPLAADRDPLPVGTVIPERAPTRLSECNALSEQSIVEPLQTHPSGHWSTDAAAAH